MGVRNTAVGHNCWQWGAPLCSVLQKHWMTGGRSELSECHTSSYSPFWHLNLLLSHEHLKLGLSRRPIKMRSPNAFQTARLILLQQAENKPDGSLGPFLISGHAIIFLFRACVTCWVTLSGLIFIGTLIRRVGGRSQWTPMAQAWKACRQHAIFHSLQRWTAVAYSCPPYGSLKGCIYKAHFWGLPELPGMSLLLPFAGSLAGHGCAPDVLAPCSSLSPPRLPPRLLPAAQHFSAGSLSLSLCLLCFPSNTWEGDIVLCLSVQVHGKSQLGPSVL